MSTPPVLPAFPTFPGRNTADADQYVADASAWGGAMPPWTDSVRDLGAWMALQASGLAASFRLPLMATYTFDAATAVADPGPGKLRLNAGSTALLADAVDNLGMSAIGRLSRLTGTSTRKGSIAVYKSGDPTASVLADVTLATAVGGAGGYYNLTLSNVVSTGAALADGDDVVLVIQTNGDKGDQGNAGVASQWALDSTVNISGSPSLVTLALPTTGFSDIKIEVDGLAPSPAAALTIAASTNGSTFGAFPISLTGSASLLTGFILLTGYRQELTAMQAQFQTSGALSSPEGMANTSPPVGVIRNTGGLSHVRLGLSSGAFTNTGAVRVYKR